MPAHKGNRYAAPYWIKRKGEENLIRISIRIPESHLSKLDALLTAEQSRSDLLRDAVAEYLKLRGVV